MDDGGDRLSLETIDERYRALRLARPEVMASLRRSVSERGLLHPVVVNRLTDGRAVLLDGFKRVSILREQGADSVPVQWVVLSASQAEASILAYNAPHRGLCELEEAWLVRSLCRSHRLSQTKVSALLSRHKSWVCRRLALCERLAESVQDDVRLGLVSGSVAREVARLPRGNQGRVVKVIQEHGLSSALTRKLCVRWLEAPDEPSREAVLAEPVLPLVKTVAIKSAGSQWAPVRDPRLSSIGEAVRQVALRCPGPLSELADRVTFYPPDTLERSEVEIVHELLAIVSLRLLEAEEAVRHWQERARGLEAHDV